MLGIDLPLWLQGVHGLLLAVVIYTDLTHHKVYLPWSALAVLVGLGTAFVSPWPTVNLVCGALGFLWGLFGLSRAHWGGGDVWMLTYLCLTFGLHTVAVLLVATVALLVGLVSRRLHWGQTIPLAAVWGLAAALVLLGSALPVHVVAQPAPPGGTTNPAGSDTVPRSPLPTPTPSSALAEHAQQAADAVALVGLADAGRRPMQAEHAAQELRTLAQTTPFAQHAWLLTWWAAALERYADGQPGALTFITQFSHLNTLYRKGVLSDAHE
jgi:hypothetical protein